MQRGPLPPHERTWRHPSELAAEERALVLAEPSPRGARFLALTSGTLGLLAVGLLMISITPKRTESPIALSASTTPAPVPFNAIRSSANGAPDRIALRAESDNSLDVIATPLGDGRFAIVTRASLTSVGSTVIDVRLPSGRMSAASIVTASHDTVIIALSTIEPGHAIAVRRPDEGDIVTVMASPPVTIAYHDVGTLTVEEGTPVVDDDGRLVGICSRRIGSDHVRLIGVSEALDDATNVVP